MNFMNACLDLVAAGPKAISKFGLSAVAVGGSSCRPPKVRASLAAASASNVAMSAAIAAVEGHRQCMQASCRLLAPTAENMDRAPLPTKSKQREAVEAKTETAEAGPVVRAQKRYWREP